MGGTGKRLHTPQTGNRERLGQGYRVLAHVNCLSKSRFHTRDMRDGVNEGKQELGAMFVPGPN